MEPKKNKPEHKYNRVLLKLSGEALAGEKKVGYDQKIVQQIAHEIVEIHKSGVEIAIVIGAGNIFRGSTGEELGIDRITGDYMGMLATVMNSLAVKNELLKYNVPVKVMSAIHMSEVADNYRIEHARGHLANGEIVIIAGGSGHPFFTTDTASSLRAIELGADVMLKATRVDGVYTADPEKDSSAKKIEDITYSDIIQKQLKVLDLTAVSLCKDNNLPIVVFNLFDKDSLNRIICGDNIGTLIHGN